jgi:L-2,4-diaminobutyrate decarboxylase
MVSAESHYSVDRAARIMGLGTEGIIKVPVNDQYQLRTDLLEEYLDKATRSGKKVFCVIGCACSTSTGAYDDLMATGEFAKKNNLWFHADGAHGAAAIYSPRYKHLLKGIEQTDSLIIDFHKMMMTPSLSTAVIYKQTKASYKTFAQKAQYLWADQEKEEWHNSGKRTFECTKPMSVLSIYTLMRMYGDELFKQNVETLYSLAGDFAKLMKLNKNFELAYEPQSNIVCFRYLSKNPAGEVNKNILQRLVADGRYYIVSTTLNEKFYLRTAIMNPLTRLSEFEGLLDMISNMDI